MEKFTKEWFIKAPWGKIAVTSFGDQSNKAVLLVHGRQDSADSFLPLLQWLPDRYYYVAINLPGSGNSDRFPPSAKLCRFHFMIAIQAVITHMEWSQFTYIGHSMGAELGLFYNKIYPGRIKRIVHLDPGPSLLKLVRLEQHIFYKQYYENYYSNYAYNNWDFKLYTKKQAVEAVKNARSLTDELAEIVLSKNLIPLPGDKYRLTWDKRQRSLAHFNIPHEYSYELFSKNVPPTLIIEASNTEYATTENPAKKWVGELAKLENVKTVQVVGGHDIHLTDCKKVGQLICEFLDCNAIGSKL